MENNKINYKYKIIYKFTFIIILFFLPKFLPLTSSNYILHIIDLIGIYLILTLGLNLVIGYVGLLDLGFSAFFAIGCYTAAILNLKGFPFIPTLIIAMFLTGLVRFILGTPILRLRGDYLAIVTLGFGEITRIVLNNLDSITCGPKGLPCGTDIFNTIKIASLSLTTDLHFYYLILLSVLFTFYICEKINNSKYGRAFIAIKEDEIAAKLTGIDVTKYKAFAFTLSGIFAGLAGFLYINWSGFVSPENFTFWDSVLLVSMIVLGGMGSNIGVILGTIILIGTPEVLRVYLKSDLAQYRYLVFGIAMVLVVIFKPKGLIPRQVKKYN